jgi:hypothetical protein
MRAEATSDVDRWTIAFRRRRVDWLIFAVFLATCAVLDAHGIEHTQPDTHTYVQPAENLLAGAGFATRTAAGALHPEFIRTPLYPLYLAAFLGIFGSAGMMASIWFQRIAWGLIMVLAFPGIGEGTRRPARVLCAVGKALCLLSPQTLVNASTLMSDLSFACLVALGLHATTRAMREGGGAAAVGAGLSLGLATLTRPVGKLLPLVIAAVWLISAWWPATGRDERPLALRWGRTRIVVVFLIAAMALPLGWSARNWQLSGHFTLTPFFGANIALHRREMIERLVREGATFGGPGEDRYAQLVAEQDNALSALTTLKPELGLDDFAGDALAGRVGMQALRRHPLIYVRDSIYHAFNLAMAPADAQELCSVLFRWDRAVATPLVAAIRDRVWSALAFQAAVRCGGLLGFIVLPAAVCLVTMRRRGWRPADGIYLASGLYFVVATSLVITTYGRFLLPVLPSVAHVLCRER